MLRDNIGVPCNLLPSSVFILPDRCDAQIIRLSGVGHLPAPGYPFPSGNNHNIAADTKILDVTFKSRDYKETGIHHAQHLLLADELVQRIGDHKTVGPQSGKSFRVVPEKGLNFFGAKPPDFPFDARLIFLRLLRG